MKIRIQFITPCFCGGADPLKAEIRPSAIRGELRWWFRCLGGSSEQEKSVFGAAAGKGRSSSVQIRVLTQEPSTNFYSPGYVSPNDPQAYLHYLLTAPNDKGYSRMWETAPDPVAKKKGVIRPESQIPPDSNFDFQIRTLRPINSPDVRELLHTTIDCFLHFGAIGYRMTRGFGAWVAPERLCSRKEVEEKLKFLAGKGFSHEFIAAPSNDALQVLRQVEGRLKGDKTHQSGLRYHHPAETTKSPLGYSSGPGTRQTSAVRFRPCAFRTKNGDLQFSLLILQAPDSVLGAEVKEAYAGKTRIIPEK